MKIVSKKIRNSARGEDCTLRVSPNCGNNETTILAHFNSNFRGMGLKSPDLFTCYCCAECHVLLDSSKVDFEDQQRANQETLMKLYAKDLIKVAS